VIHSLSATSCHAFEPAKINRHTIFEFEQATETAFENGFINGDTAAGRDGASLSIRLIRGKDDLDSDGTFGSITIVLEFQSVIIMLLVKYHSFVRELCLKI
jgi:hypothetical protein